MDLQRNARLRGLLQHYEPPSFYRREDHDGAWVPTYRLSLANLPTPIQPWALPELPEDVGLDIKRDDFTGGIETTGNKVRKLEFLLADAIDRGADVVVTAGGTQSNHARATATCCARLGLPCHLFLRRDSDGRNGNFLLDRLVGARIHQISREQQLEWLKETPHWVERRAELLSSDLQCSVVGIPIGGSNHIGCWGYLHSVGELAQQVEGQRIEAHYSDICACTGSGGTLGGLGVGLELYRQTRRLDASQIRLHSYGVSDSPDFFLDAIDGLIRRIYSGPSSRSLMRMGDAKGLGYARSTTEELQFISRVARETGVVLDFCYTGKTVFGMWRDLVGGAFRLGGKKLLYIHTGGGPSVFDRADLFEDVLPVL